MISNLLTSRNCDLQQIKSFHCLYCLSEDTPFKKAFLKLQSCELTPNFLSGISIDTISFLILVNQEIEACSHYVKYDIKQPLEPKSGYKSQNYQKYGFKWKTHTTVQRWK